MQITGIIAEYNPLHLGHQFHIEETRKITGADYVITVLSGDFVQRGIPAILDKHTRTKLALEAGSDLVLELPVPYALSSGEGFGFGGVSLLHGLGCVGSLSFGSEEGSLDSLADIAKVLTAEAALCAKGNFTEHETSCRTAYQTAYQTALKSGLTHPAARNIALAKAYPSLDLSVLDGSSNNMLSLEYLKALYSLRSDIQAVTIKRQGQGYLEQSIDTQSFSSATAIREALKSQVFSSSFPEENSLSVIASLKDAVPVYTAETLSQALFKNRLVFLDDFSSLLHYKLLSLSYEELLAFWEVTPDFANKTINHLRNFESFTQFANLLWTKDTTYARVCRTLMHILLDIKGTTWDIHESVPYARILGFRKNSLPLLSEIKQKTSIPLISKLADAEKILSAKDYELLKLDMKAAHIYDSVVLHKSGAKIKHEMQKQIVVL